MTMRKRPAHAGLERHNQRLADANAALREAEIAERRAASTLEAARDAVREAHDLGADPSEPTAALDQAKAAAEAAVLAREGLEQRVARATAGRENYLSQNGQALLAELAPDCEQATADLRARAEALLGADKRWRELSATVAALLRAQRLIPHQNAGGQHGLEDAIRTLKRALQSEVISPAPHMTAANAARIERETVSNLRREREEAAA